MATGVAVARIRLHDLRHAFVREASSAGIVTAQGQKITGHATSHVWESYDDSGVREARTSMRKIAARQQAIMEEWRDQSDERKVVNI